MEIADAEQALALHGPQQVLSRRALLEAVDGADILEQERQIEDLQFFGVLSELGERWRRELHVAEQHGAENGVVVEQLRTRENLDLHLAGQALLDEFLELERG